MSIHTTRTASKDRLKVLWRWFGIALVSIRPLLYDYNRRSWFDSYAAPSALEGDGPEVLSLTRMRRGFTLLGWRFFGNDMCVLPEALRPVADAIREFWERVGLPVSPDIVWGRATGQVPRGFRLLLAAYDEVYDRLGRYRRWREILEKTRSRAAFLQYCRAKGFGHLLPRTYPYQAGEIPDHATVLHYFSIAPVWWVKLDVELFERHSVLRCSNPEEMLAAIGSMGGKAFIIQQHMQGESYSLSYEVVRTWYGRRKAVLVYAAKELVVDGAQRGAHAHRDYEVLRQFTDELAQHLVRMGLRHLFGFGIIYNPETGEAFINDNNLRGQGGHPVWQLLIKAILYGMPDQGMEFYYEYLDLSWDTATLCERRGLSGRHQVAGTALMEAILLSPLRPDIDTGDGLFPVGINADGHTKLAAFGPKARETIEAGKVMFGLRLFAN